MFVSQVIVIVRVDAQDEFESTVDAFGLVSREEIL
jgi:hypothetical protein